MSLLLTFQLIVCKTRQLISEQPVEWNIRQSTDIFRNKTWLFPKGPETFYNTDDSDDTDDRTETHDTDDRERSENTTSTESKKKNKKKYWNYRKYRK